MENIKLGFIIICWILIFVVEFVYYIVIKIYIHIRHEHEMQCSQISIKYPVTNLTELMPMNLNESIVHAHVNYRCNQVIKGVIVNHF